MQREKGTRTPEIFIALVVSLIALLAFITIRDVVFTSAQQGDKNLNDITEAPMISIESAAETSVVVRNRGTNAANMTLVRVYIDNLFATCSWNPAMLEPGKSAVCQLAVSCSGSSVRISSGTQDIVSCF